jgi:TPR repeat protein
MYSEGCGVAEDVRQAEALYQRACDYGSVMGCGALGNVMQDVERAIVLLEQTCTKGYSFSCGTLGIRLFNRDRTADVERAADLLDKACREDERFCSHLADLVSKWKLEPRFAATHELVKQACEERDTITIRREASGASTRPATEATANRATAWARPWRTAGAAPQTRRKRSRTTNAAVTFASNEPVSTQRSCEPLAS